MTRPDPVRWVWYAFGGRLPDRYRDWVVHDATGPGWRWRYAAQIVVRALPFLVAGFIVLMLLPGTTLPMALGAMAVSLAITLYLTVTSAGEFRNVRLVQHGIRPERSTGPGQ
jgi:Family of unknown function (DUF5313)